MKKIILFAIFLICACVVKAQNPTGVPQLFNGKWYKFNQFLGVDSALLVNNKDTNWLPRQPALVFWQNAASDTSFWVYNGKKWNKVGVVLDTTSLSNRINLRVKYSDTASMLSPYLRKLDTTSLSNRINLKADKATTLTINSVTYDLSANRTWTIPTTDTTSLSNRINLKLNISDTAAMLSPYLRKVDTASLSNRINLKADKATTLTINGTTYDLSANRSWTIPATDTTSLSNRINLKLNISDTAAMLSPYQIAINARVKYTDTASMLAPYLRKLDTASLSNRINLKQNILSLTTTGTSGAATLVGATLNIPQYQGVLTNPVTGTGTINTVAKFTSSSAIGNSNIKDDGNAVTVNTTAGSFGALQVGDYNGGIMINKGSSGAALIFKNTLSSDKLWDINPVGNDLSIDESNIAPPRMYFKAGGHVLINGTADDVSGGQLQVAGTIQQSVTSAMLKASSTGVITAATSGSDYQAPITLTTTGSSGASTLIGSTLNIPNYGSATGFVPYTGATNDVNIGTHNYYGNAFFNGFTSAAASGTQIVLTVLSAPEILITGSGGQTIKLPDATTLSNGTVYSFNNNQSSGAILVNNNSNTLIESIPSGGYAEIMLLNNSSAAGSWDKHFQAPSNVSWSTNTFDYPGSITSATWNGNVVQPNRGGTGQSTYTDGQLLIGNSTGNTLSKSTLTAGTGISITNGSGSISVASSITQYTDALARSAISLTTTGTSGAATYSNSTGVLNIPQYQAAGTYVTSVTGTSPIVSSGGTTPAISIPAATSSVNGYLSSTDWSNFNGKMNYSDTVSLSNRINAKQNALTLTTTGSSGAATLTGATLNIPNYGSALSGYVPYTGATGPVNLGAYDLTVNGLKVGIGGNIYNTAVGYTALSSTTTGYSNVAVGYQSLTINSSGNSNTAIGTQSLIANNTGSNNTGVGTSSLINNSSGGYNTGIGASVLFQNTTGNYNTASGFQALNSNTTGSSNTGTGYQSLGANTTGTQNTSDGYLALGYNITGNNNTSTGYQSLYSNTGSSNTASGHMSLFNSTGNNNTAIGASAGYGTGSNANTTGANNIFIGYQSVGTSATDNNKTWIGNSSTTQTWLGGNLVVNGTTISNATYTYTLPTASGTLALVGGSGVGTVTSVATGLGLSGGTITTSGTLLVDTASASILSRQRAANTYYLASNPNGYTSNTGTVTSVATGLGLSGGTISTSGTLLVDTSSASILSRQRAANTYATTSSLSGYLPLTGGTLTGALGGTSATFSGTIAAATGSNFTGTSVNSRMLVTASGVANTVLGFNNSGSTVNGVINNAGYVGILQDYPFIITTNDIERFKIAASTGAATFSGTLQTLASGGYSTTTPQLNVGIADGTSSLATVKTAARFSNNGSFYITKITLSDNNISDCNLWYSPGVTGATNLFQIGVGTNTPQFTLNGSGSVIIANLGTGTVTASSGTLSTVSDSSYKIADGFIEDALPSVMNLKPRYFYWKNKSGLDTTIRQLGFYAQEVNSAIGEEAANTPKKDSPWGINDRSVIAMLTKAIQEQQAQIKELQTEIQTLKNK